VSGTPCIIAVRKCKYFWLCGKEASLYLRRVFNNKNVTVVYVTTFLVYETVGFELGSSGRKR